METNKTALILGGGVAGCTTAYFLKKKGFNVTLLEGQNHLGGGVWTQFYGGHPYTFGPRIFFTEDEMIINHLTSIIKMRSFDTISYTYVEEDGNLYNYPLQSEDLDKMPDHEEIKKQLNERKVIKENFNNFEEYWLNAIGPNLYNKFVKNYSKKMWGIESNKQLNANWEWVNRGTPIRNGDKRLYCDAFQGYPKNMDGYNSYFKKSVDGIDVILNCFVDFLDIDKFEIHTNQGIYKADIIINSIHVDKLFNFEYGHLQFCGRTFIPLWLPIKNAMPDDITWVHYSGEEMHTRTTEFKKITNYESDSTLLGIEIPNDKGRYYPVQSPNELKRFDLYKNLFPDNFFSIGRPGKFCYQGIPDSIKDALILNEKI